MLVCMFLITGVWTIPSAFGHVSRHLICYDVYNSKSNAKQLQSKQKDKPDLVCHQRHPGERREALIIWLF